ncbi:hypothetical protein AUP44_01890 [Tistrella mobilis]|uniref:Uncharacterized protein n=1 Tax=Tistrella mobilis TaxID=171437 RepID=A0A162M219_9PROT|nr:hypothetical protein AUP44_01890 [Tistrella mobilis]
MEMIQSLQMEEHISCSVAVETIHMSSTSIWEHLSLLLPTVAVTAMYCVLHILGRPARWMRLQFLLLVSLTISLRFTTQPVVLSTLKPIWVNE